MGVPVVQQELGPEAVLKEAVSNADGGTDAPPLAGGPLGLGSYEIASHIAVHFAKQGGAAGRPPFFDVVPIRCAIAELERYHHVPLLALPWAYSTYRGS